MDSERVSFLRPSLNERKEDVTSVQCLNLKKCPRVTWHLLFMAIVQSMVGLLTILLAHGF